MDARGPASAAGQRRSMTLTDALLAPFSLLYAAAVGGRNCYYGAWPGAVRDAGVPVISVGNITVGGTGKTPLVIEIARRLLDRGRRPAIVTRGYGARPGQPADEVLEFRDALPAAPVIVDADRVRGAAAARAQHAADVVVLDDGFQHRRIARALDLVLIDALNPFGNGWLLPAGRLREPLRNMRRAHALIVTRANQAESAALAALETRLRELAPAAALYRANVVVDRLVDSTGTSHPPASIRGRRVLPVCGIGNPRTFFHALGELGADCAPPRIFPDHWPYSAADAVALAARALAAGAALVVTTRKDWVKLAPLWPPALDGRTVPPLVRLDVRAQIVDDPARPFDALLEHGIRT